MTFQPGQSGNPAGRAVGSRNKQTLAVEARLFEHAQELVDDLVRREVARSAQTLGFEHFFAGRPADNNYARQVAEMNADEAAADVEQDDLPERHPDENRSTQDPLYRWNRENTEAHVGRWDAPGYAPEADDSDGGERRTEAG